MSCVVRHLSVVWTTPQIVLLCRRWRRWKQFAQYMAWIIINSFKQPLIAFFGLPPASFRELSPLTPTGSSVSGSRWEQSPRPHHTPPKQKSCLRHWITDCSTRVKTVTVDWSEGSWSESERHDRTHGRVFTAMVRARLRFRFRFRFRGGWM